MKWKDKITEWEKGIPQTYPSNIKKRFLYQTSVITRDMDTEYEEKFIESDRLEKINQDYDPFAEHFIKPKNKYVTSFLNLSKKSLLVVPVPLRDSQKASVPVPLRDSQKPSVPVPLRDSQKASIPVPVIKANKTFNYTTIKDFIDNAPQKQQIALWKHVAKKVKQLLKVVDTVYINTHGLGVYYLHVRLDITPKYYYSKRLIKPKTKSNL
jgi:hypothetical protein